MSLAATEPPRSEAELLLRARGLAGRTVGELCASAGRPCPSDQRRAKGLVGELVERALGAPRATGRSAPDFEGLGIEVKTLPIGSDRTPRESTFVCAASLPTLPSLEWETSPVRAKLARVLWVPVEADRALPLPSRRVGQAFLWSPSPAEELALRADWEEIAARVGCGDLESITAHLGQCLQLRPKARSSRVLGRARDDGGALVRTPPRGFYLRRSFTLALLARAC